MPETNWAGNLTYAAEHIQRPRSLEELQAVLARADRVHVLGSRHAFNTIADAAQLISLEELPGEITIDTDARSVSCSASTRYGDLAQHLDAHGLALHNLASLPHISVGGAIATGTHGSGDGNRNLATAVRELQLVTSDGELRSVRRGDADFPALVVGLGALGAVVRVTLDVEPTYEVRQRVYEHLAFETLVEQFDKVMGAGYSVSIFTGWGPADGQIWVKTRATDDARLNEAHLFGAVAAARDRHPVDGVDPVNCTAQMGRPGAWWDRLPHFRMGFKPSVGQELQSEYLIPRRHAAAALAAVRALRERVLPVLQVSEIRTVAADALWMSPQEGTDTVAIHFTWIPDQARVERVLADVESSLQAFDARPHWGKLFLMPAQEIARLYPRVTEFVAVQERLDPRGAFRNRWFERHVAAPERHTAPM